MHLCDMHWCIIHWFQLIEVHMSKKTSKQFVSLSIRLTEGEYQAALAEQQRIEGAAGVEVSLNAVLTGLIRSGLVARLEVLKAGGVPVVPPQI